MIKLIDLLNEGKQVGILYHFTDMSSLIKILETNILKASNKFEKEKPPTVSLTRDKLADIRGVGGTGTKTVRISIDGDKLSNKYKIQPFQDPKIKKDEMEEKVLTNGIDNFSNYVIKIIIPKKRFSPGKSAYDYSTDQYDNKFKGVGGEGFFGDIKNYTNWLKSKGFNNFEII